ncbi:MBL fold metallo-hydrolase [Streptoalloteichus hindustanus]|uniref:Cyclase n=1 Tax=Streptoalloteichus hindustanus TaxID=2017 RepID=A0A1M5M835_STRHI|nr:MBL fold metallo-hydrolase [Streptoalloteichus hindustanus]SHG73420.1 cyclase [Streptoalloteichus hindustanus]
MASSPRDRDVPPPPRLEEISDGLYAYVQPDGGWFISNCGALVGRHGVISVDACSTAQRTLAYLDALSTVTDQPVRTAVVTHHHADHTYGLYLFQDATIIAHEHCRQAVIDQGLGLRSVPWLAPVDWGDIRLAPATLTYTDRLTLWLDDLRCEVLHVGRPAHTVGDTIVWVPDRKVLYAGDLISNGVTPVLLHGSLTGWIHVLEHVVKPLGAHTVVPGHGPVCGPETIDHVLDYLHFVQRVATETKQAGLTPLQAAHETDLGEFRDLVDPERIVLNLHRAHAELDGLTPGQSLNMRSAMQDLVAYNGGRPLTCHA